MLPRMTRRTSFARFLALLCAAVQLVSPGVSSIADGKFAGDNASAPVTHVEATTTDRCPVVHSPDCAVCRYLSGSAAKQPPTAFADSKSTERETPGVERFIAGWSTIALPPGRGPPLA